MSFILIDEKYYNTNSIVSFGPVKNHPITGNWYYQINFTDGDYSLIKFTDFDKCMSSYSKLINQINVIDLEGENV